MTTRRPWIKAGRPLILPLILVASLVALTEMLNSLSIVDKSITALVDVLPDGLAPGFSLIADLGSVPVLILVAIIVAGYEFWQRHPVRAWLMLASLSSLLIFRIIKEIVRRARPVSEFVAGHGLHDFSFPSGHASGSAAVYGTAAVLLWGNSQRRGPRIVSLALIVLILLIGLSRIYLGAHYPTDVLGGWFLALIVVSGLRSISLAVAKRSPRPAHEALADSTEAQQL